MKRLALVLAGLASAAGCKKQPDHDAALATLNDFKAKACACKTADCAVQVERAMFDWSDRNRAETAAWAKTEQLVKELSPITDATKKCLDTAKGGGAARGSAAAQLGSAVDTAGSAAN